MIKVVLLTCLLGVALAGPQYDYEQPAQNPPAPSNLYEQPARNPPPRPAASNNRPQNAPAPNGEGMPYELEWGVDDEESGNSYSHVESSDGDVTRGEYRVLLPDGRTQVVTFFDDGNGYNAEVTYEKK